ncbi:MAG: prepilin-type N-terminal cleavage/methylation domain-containing protein [Deltaproteobacteria bacterium]|nr:prepilin-type N-terminal cleavage/methylation domain-containing protein [Deltaproteobacteria bacterium]MBW2111386.1 prepilin-type N-terminal cleavage/methylation domain-containing protein [Deltaproteobacteria bacterium]MBW2353955.1 prepilin-type N-terminal cleavage/methylation domain-containing protein [Deltaproteobacteria bacterium]HDZ90627.1 prepilin-type N-terminal cleavage/methylation domain-containing protein [Deltaproteobacteria bacterium]
MQGYTEKREQGFTLIELLVAMVIALVLISAVSAAFLSQQKNYAVQEQVSEMIQTARASMDMIIREIRMAGYDPTGTLQRDDPTEAGGVPFVGIPYDSSQLEIVADIAGTTDAEGNVVGDGDTDDANEDIVYKFYDAADPTYPNQIKRKTGNGTFQPFVENVEAFSFTYLDADGNATTNTADIRQIKIAITTKTAEPDPDYSHPTYSDGYRRYTLTTLIRPINLAL